MEYLLAFNRVRNKVRGVFLLLGVCIFLARHSSVSFCLPHETERSGKGEYVYNIEDHVTEAVPDDHDYVENYPYIDYDYIEQYHEVLWHNIYAVSTNDYAGTPLAEYLSQIEERDREQLAEDAALYGHRTSLSMDYAIFDFKQWDVGKRQDGSYGHGRYDGAK